MEDSSRNWHRLEDVQACAFLSDRAQRRWLTPFIERECSVGEAARASKVNPTLMYKRVQRMLGLGLLRETRVEARAGKPIRFYRALANSFFIPFRVFPPERINVANRVLYQDAFRRALERLYRDVYFVELDWGARTVVAPSGDVYLQIVTGSGEDWDYLALDAPAVASGWNPLWLDPEDAKSLQRELVGVMSKYLNKRGSRAYLTGLFLCEAQPELELIPPRNPSDV
jgi:hypothetical protein